MNTVPFALALLLSVSVYAAGRPNTGEEFLRQIKQWSNVAPKPLDSQPSDFGGKAPQIGSPNYGKHAAYSADMAVFDEQEFQAVLKEVVYPIEKDLMARKAEWAKYAVAQAPIASFSEIAKKFRREMEGIKEFAWELKANADLSNAEGSASKWSAYLSSFSKLEYAAIIPLAYSTPVAERSVETSLPMAYIIDARLDLRGVNKEKLRQQDRAKFKFKVVKVEGRWKVHSLAFTEGETLTAKNTSFEKKESFDHGQITTYLREEAIRRGGYAVSLTDFDGDGNVDLLVGQMGAMEIFKGDGKGGFMRIKNKALGLEDETLVKSAVFADFDNDGKKDLLLVRFAPSEEKGKDISFYHGEEAGKFKKMQVMQGRIPAYYAMPAAVADFNGDGRLDFYIGFPGVKDFTVLSPKASLASSAKSKYPEGLFYNVNGTSFTDVTKEKLPNWKAMADAGNVFPHSSMAIDYNLDGKMDIVVVDDKANLSPLYKNAGDGSFTQVADSIGVTNYDFGMGFTAADLDGDGQLEFIYTNVNFAAAERMHNSMAVNWSDQSRKAGSYGLRVFKTKNGRAYSDVTALTGIDWAGEGLAGVEVIDYNNDGRPDLFVANGLWSGSEKSNDLSSLFVRSFVKGNLDYQEVMGTQKGIAQANSSYMKILMSFEGDVHDLRKVASMHPSMAGYQRKCLFRNNGDGTFTEVGYMAGVDSMADGYVVATADLNRDGKMDLVLRNADPGTRSHMYAPIEVFMNHSESSSKSVILSFEGAKSNRDGIGVIAEATVGGKKFLRHLVANNGAAQSQGVLHFGLGGADKIDEIDVRWPSGAREVLRDVTPGYRRVVEGNSEKVIAVLK